MAVEVGMKYENRKSKRTATVVRVDDKAKTCILQYDDDGKYPPCMSFPSLSKSWRKLVDDVVEVFKTEEKVEESPSNVVTEILSEKKHVVKTAKKEAAKKVKSAKKPTKKADKPKKVVEKKPKADKPKKADKKPKTAKAPIIKYDESIMHQIEDAINNTPYRVECRARLFNVDVLKKCFILLDDDGCRKFVIKANTAKFSISMPKSKVPDGMTPHRYLSCVVCPNAPTFDFTYGEINKIAELIK